MFHVVVTAYVFLFYEQLTLEESKEADTARRQASHRLSRGLHNKVVYIDVRSVGDLRVMVLVFSLSFVCLNRSLDHYCLLGLENVII